MKIPFNKPYLTGKEMHYIYQSVYSGKISGNGIFTQKCQHFFEERFGFGKTLLTTSCTDALEMSAILSNLQTGDEVIVPSFTFVSTALAFDRQGAKVVFADSNENNPNLDVDKLETLITPKTRVIVVVHYAGIACDMDKVRQLAEKYQLIIIEDAAQAIDSYYKGKPLGSIGQMAAFSFHETKNINSGEGGMIALNDEKYFRRAEIIWEKGTNRAEFFRGEVNKYGWVDTGSSFLPSEIIAAYLYAQIENLDQIQRRRTQIWNLYQHGLIEWCSEFNVTMPFLPDFATNNAHMFYLVCPNISFRTNLIEYLKNRGIHSVFHYLSLHSSPYFLNRHDKRVLKNADRYTNCLLRLPLFYELSDSDIAYIISEIKQFKN